MSFGFGVGDFLAIIQLANKIRKEFVEAPAQFKDLSDEVRNLSIVVQDLEVELSGKELDRAQEAELRNIVQNCRGLLNDIQKLVGQYSELKHDYHGSKVIRAWKRLRWEPTDAQYLRTRIGSQVSLLNAFNGRVLRSNVSRLIDYQERQEQERILDWLSPVNYASKQSELTRRRQPDSGHWFLQSSQLQTWLTMPEQTLFCYGIPGAGKTMLTSALIEELESRYGIDATVGIAYIYCSYQTRKECLMEDIIANLIKQFLQDRGSLPGHVRELYNKNQPRGIRPTFRELLLVLQIVCFEYAQIYIVIDGLDELRLATYSLDLLLDELLAFQEARGLNILVTTRLIPEIAAKFQHKPAIEIRANEEDVTAYLRSSIPKLPSFVLRNPELQNEIVSWIAKITDGMFLLADLYLNSLVGKTSPKAIRLALKDISLKAKTYDAAYDNVMERIQGQPTDKRDMAMHILSWITCAQRSITAVELQHALAVEVDETYFDEDNMPDLNDMFTVCAGLVVQDPLNNIIRFAHHTSYEYFNQTKNRWFPNAHCNIARTCVTYLSYDAFGSGPCLTDVDFERRLTQFPLYSYAATNWGHHAREKLSDERLASEFLISPAKLNASVQALFARNTVEGSRRYSQVYPLHLTALHLAAIFGLNDVSLKLINLGCEVNVADSLGRTPLSWAAIEGYDMLVTTLLRSGADPCHKDGDGRTPLSLAVIDDHLAVVDNLLQQGADPNTQDVYGHTPLSLAASTGREQSARRLLATGVDPNSTDTMGRTPLSWAASGDHVGCTDILLRNGAVLETRDVYANTPLSWATVNGCHGAVQLLLDRGANASSQYFSDLAPGTMAYESGHDTTVKLFAEPISPRFGERGAEPATFTCCLCSMKPNDRLSLPRRVFGKDVFKAHMFQAHFTRSTYRCPDCSGSYPRRDKIRGHLKLQHRKTANRSDVDKCKVEKPPPRACPVCQKVIHSWEELEACIRVHCGL